MTAHVGVSRLANAVEVVMNAENGDRSAAVKAMVEAAVPLLRHVDSDPEARKLERWLRDFRDGKCTDGDPATTAALLALRIRHDAYGNEPVEQLKDSGIFVDWSMFWTRDRREADWLYDDVLARGRGHSIFAAHKQGKSLVALWIVLELVRAGNLSIYLDYEMGEDDLYERLVDMGVGPDTDLSRLHYALLPSLPPLDEPEGAKALLALVDDVQESEPDAHVVVVIDTTARAVAGEENSADTIRNFYRWTGLHLKQRGCTWARLDHAGKDLAKGQRGSSSKGDDVDVVWRLTRTDNDGIELRREASRMSWVPERVGFAIASDPLRYVRVARTWPAGTKETAALLDGLGIPATAGERPAGKALRDAGHKAGQAVVRAAQAWRRESP